MKRRELLKLSAVAAATLLSVSSLAFAQAKEPIKVGILHSLSGTMAISETALKETALMTIDEINKAGGGLFRLPRKIPFNVAMELTLTGDPIDAERAHHFGLVNYLTEPGQALERAKDLARQIEANAPVAVRASRRVVLAAATEDEATGWRLSGEAFAEALSSEDNKEGLMAFIEKRPPNWQGR